MFQLEDGSTSSSNSDLGRDGSVGLLAGRELPGPAAVGKDHGHGCRAMKDRGLKSRPQIKGDAFNDIRRFVLLEYVDKKYPVMDFYVLSRTIAGA